MNFKRYFEELKRRKVFKAAVAYVAIAWILVQFAADVLPIFEVPPLVQQVIIITLILGFPAILIFAWIYDVTPGGIKKTDDHAADSLTKKRVGRLNRIIITTLSILAFVLLYNLFSEPYTPKKEGVTQQMQTASVGKSIAVLPLKNWSGDPDLEYISDGMTDAVIIRLSNIQSIKKVVPFTSVVAYKETNKSIAEIAKELGVNNILQGSFQLSGEDVNIKMQMLEGNTEKPLWNNEYRTVWKSDEIFEIQATVAENVAKNINAQITEGEYRSIRRIPTANKDAYRFYLQAEYQFNKLSQDGFDKARQLYEEAIALDSTFIEAYIGMANSFMLSGLVWGYIPQDEAWQKSKDIFQEALRIDQIETKEYQKWITFHLATGSFLFEWEFESIESIYADITQVSNAIVAHNAAGYGFDYARKIGRNEDALRMADLFLELSPINAFNYVHKACALFLLGRHVEAKQIFSTYDEIYNGEYFYLMESAKYYYYLGELNKSKKNLELFNSQFPVRPPIITWLETIHADEENNVELVKQNLASLKDLYIQKAPGSPAWFIALFYCHKMDYDKAFQWLQKSYDQHEVEMTWLRAEPLLAPVRNDQRYIELYKKIGFPIPPLSHIENAPRKIQ